MSRTGRGKTPKAGDQARLDQALARLIANTRRTRRAKNLLEIASEQSLAESLLGGRRALAKRIGISEEMLREFASVNDLEDSVKDLVGRGLLTSVDAAYRISLLPKEDQLLVAKAYVGGELSGKDLRDVVSLRRSNVEVPISELVNRVRSGRRVVEYAVRLRCSPGAELDRLRGRFQKLVGEEHIRSVNMEGNVVTLVIDEEGKRRIQAEASKRGITKRELIRSIKEGAHQA